MLQSKLFTKTSKQSPKDEVSLNAQLLIRAGFVDKLMAGVYTYLPLGLRVLNKIKAIVREEMDKVGAQEILMPALSPKENWVATGRWDGLDVLFHLDGNEGKEYALGATHEEVVTPLLKKFILSYKDLPQAVYQIQDKFRNEKRAKPGLMRGREFVMKDLYSFHVDEADLDQYYEKMQAAYASVFLRCGLDARLVEASGGTFSKFSHEYQVFTEFGEDEIYTCECGHNQNKELVENDDLTCPYCRKTRTVKKAIEVGNIFKLKNKYSTAFDFKFTDKDGVEKDVMMGCYGIGPSRLMGAIVEVHHDEKGIIWPRGVAPYDVHLLVLGSDEMAMRTAEEWYARLTGEGNYDVLFDDRADIGAGGKFADADLIGLPIRIVISAKTLAQNMAEVKKRDSAESEMIPLSDLMDYCK